jgi:hypothetical protein
MNTNYNEPLGAQFKSYELNAAINSYLLDPYQYAITKFDYANPAVVPGSIEEKNLKALPQNKVDMNGLTYNGVDFETLLPAYTASKKSENDYSAESYHRFLANDGNFNWNEGRDNTDLWYYGASNIARNNNNIAGAPLNVQEVNHIIFPEAQRGGLDSTNLAKYSWSNTSAFTDKTSWEAQNAKAVDNNRNCQFFNYNNTYSTDRNSAPFDKVYSFDSNYVRKIGISGPTSGSMPFN